MKQYSGDGTISDTSQSSGLFGSRGYIVDFQGFDLGSAHHATYRLSGLPSLGRANAEIELMINDPKGFSALFYGAAVDQVMTLVVLPLSALQAAGPFTLHDLRLGVVVHAIVIGLPISFSVRRFAE